MGVAGTLPVSGYAVSGLGHVRLLLEPSGTAHNPYNVYVYHDADSAMLVKHSGTPGQHTAFRCQD